MFGELAFKESWWKKFTVHPIVNTVKVPNWQSKVWQIPSICQICRTKVTPNFHRLRYVVFMCIIMFIFVALSIGLYQQFLESCVANGSWS